MASAANITAREVMNRDFVAAEKGSSISKVKNKMENHGIRAIPVVDENNNLQGAVGYRELIRFIQFNPGKTKLKKVMHQPPEFDSGDSLIELSELRINSGRKMLVNTQGNKLKGVISDEEFLQAFDDLEELENTTTMDIAPLELVTAFEDDSIDEARHKMLDNNISRLPVLDSSGDLTGIVTSTEMLRVLVPREVQSSGGTAGNRSGTEIFISGGGEKASMSEVTVEEIMDRTVITSEGHISVKQAVSKMMENDSRELLVVDGNYPETIVTVKDIIEHLSHYAPRDTILVSLVGLEVTEEKAAVHEKVEKQIRGSLGRKIDRPDEIKLRFKKADKDGKKHRYMLNVQLVADDYVINVEEEGWDMLDVVDEALSELDKRVKKETGRD